MQTDIKEMAGWIATLPDFTIGAFVRKYDLKYNTAAEIVDVFEKAGLLGEFKGAKPREVLTDNIKQAKRLVTEYINQIEVNDPKTL